MLNKIKTLWNDIHIEYRIGGAVILLLLITIAVFASRIPKVPKEMTIAQQLQYIEKESSNELVMQIQMKENIKTAETVLEKAQNALSGATSEYNKSVQRVMENDSKRNALREQLYSAINK